MNGEGYVYFSERKYNPDFVGQDSFIHLLVYQSHVTPEKFYFAWEDTYSGSNGDFTDFVSGVSGVQCSGGGALCDTGKQGVCAAGITQCSQGVLGCVQLFQPGAEQCNGIDDDCDGAIDEGATCPGDRDLPRRRLRPALLDRRDHLPRRHRVRHGERPLRRPGVRGRDLPRGPGVLRRHLPRALPGRRVPARAGLRRRRVRGSLQGRLVPLRAGVQAGPVLPRLQPRATASRAWPS